MECVKAIAYKQSESWQVESGKFMESTTGMGGSGTVRGILRTHSYTGARNPSIGSQWAETRVKTRICYREHIRE